MALPGKFQARGAKHSPNMFKFSAQILQSAKKFKFCQIGNNLTNTSQKNPSENFARVCQKFYTNSPVKFDPKLPDMCEMLRKSFNYCKHDTKQLENSSRFFQNYGRLQTYWRTLARQTFEKLLKFLKIDTIKSPIKFSISRNIFPNCK